LESQWRSAERYISELGSEVKESRKQLSLSQAKVKEAEVEAARYQVRHEAYRRELIEFVEAMVQDSSDPAFALTGVIMKLCGGSDAAEVEMRNKLVFLVNEKTAKFGSHLDAGVQTESIQRQEIVLDLTNANEASVSMDDQPSHVTCSIADEVLSEPSTSATHHVDSPSSCSPVHEVSPIVVPDAGADARLVDAPAKADDGTPSSGGTPMAAEDLQTLAEFHKLAFGLTAGIEGEDVEDESEAYLI
jgi:hypothetical protein